MVLGRKLYLVQGRSQQFSSSPVNVCMAQILKDRKTRPRAVENTGLVFPNDRLGNVKLLGWLRSSGRLGSDNLKTAFAAIPRTFSLFDFLWMCVWPYCAHSDWVTPPNFTRRHCECVWKSGMVKTVPTVPVATALWWCSHERRADMMIH